jgi:hypothetical protein
MTAGEFGEFWRIQGYRVLETASCFWYEIGPLAWMYLPYHRLVRLSWQERARLFVVGPAALIRYLSPEAGTGRSGGVFLCGDRNYDLSSLEHKARNQTRRGLERCRIERVDFGFLARVGTELNFQTFQRQARPRDTMSESQWERYCAAAERFPDFVAWAAFCDGRLAAFAVTALVEDHYSILWQSSATELLAAYPNNTLTYTITSHALTQPRVKYVSYGLQSIESTPGLDRFKLSMGFRLLPAQDHMEFNPLLRIPLKLGCSRLVRWMARRRPECELWRKAALILGLDYDQPR